MKRVARHAVLEARQSMLQVWMAISAVWVMFWLIIAMVVCASAYPFDPLIVRFGVFILIIATPPFILLALGAALQWALEAVMRRQRRRRISQHRRS